MKKHALTAVAILWQTLLVIGSASATPPSSSPPPSTDPLANLFTLFGETSRAVTSPLDRLPGANRDAENARRALCDEQERIFFDFWVPLIFNEEVQPLREQLAAITFKPGKESERRQLFWSLSASMSSLTAKLLIIQTYRTQVEAQCANSTQREEVIQSLTNMMMLVQPPNRHSLDALISGLARLAQPSARPFGQGPAPRRR